MSRCYFFFLHVKIQWKLSSQKLQSDGEVGMLMTFMSNKLPCYFSTLLVFINKGPTSTKLLICDKGFLLVFFKVLASFFDFINEVQV
jgi:hypothetical protein